MTDYYKHRQHKYFVPALALACADPRSAGIPSVSAKNAIFFAALLRAVPDQTAQYAATLSVTPGVDVGLLLAIIHHAGTPVAKAVEDRLAFSIRRSNNRGLVRVGQHVSAVRPVPVEEWPFPYADGVVEGLAAGWKGSSSSSSLAPQPWEVSGVFAQARDASTSPLDFHDYLLLSSTTVLECLWASFYATGSRAYVRRILDMSVDWAEWASSLPDQVSYLASLDVPLPADLRAKGTTTEESARSVRAQTSRIAIWSVLHHARRHPEVTATVVEECGRLAQFAADASARDPAAVSRSGLDDAAALKRLEVLPALLHLIARTAIDAPSAPGAAAAAAATTTQ
jgi:hypothetical protein